MAKRKKPASANRGAADVKAAIVRKVKRMLRNTSSKEHRDKCGPCQARYMDFKLLLAYINSMDTRAAKKPGGLGRKP